MPNYPNLMQFALYLASTHGMFTRGTTKARIEEVALSALQADGVVSADVEALEKWLGTLTPAQLETLADGEEEEMAALVAESPTTACCGGCVGQLLDDIYDNLEALL